MILWVLIGLTITCNAISHWYLSKSNTKVVYKLNVLIYVGYIIVESWLGLRDPSQRAVLLYNISNIWALSMAIRGWLRLRK